MAATSLVFILTFTALCGARVVAQELSSPTDVKLTSYNMNLVLEWNVPDGTNRSMVYSTEYRSSIGNNSPGCVNISDFKCDFTTLSGSGRSSIFEYGKYIGRVKAHLGSESSAWAESNELSLDKETIIGPPTVRLLSNKATIEVNIDDPVFVISTLRQVYSSHTYNITYWEASQNQKLKHISKIRQDRVVLDRLNPWTEYCVEVQINTLDSDPNPSVRSDPVCKTTTSEEDVQWATAVASFFVIAVIISLVVLAVVYRRTISHFFCPKDALPQHIKEYLLKLPSSTVYLDMQKPNLLEENYDPISIIAKKAVEEGGPLVVPGTPTIQSDITIRDR